MSDDGGVDEADHEGMRKHTRLILFLLVQDLNGKQQDGLCGPNEAKLCFVIRMSDLWCGGRSTFA